MTEDGGKVAGEKSVPRVVDEFLEVIEVQAERDKEAAAGFWGGGEEGAIPEEEEVLRVLKEPGEIEAERVRDVLKAMPEEWGLSLAEKYRFMSYACRARREKVNEEVPQYKWRDVVAPGVERGLISLAEELERQGK